MAGLVEQLQADALNQEVSVATLLRKVKVAAVKLRLDDTVDWANHELNGYTEEVPPYRIVRGQCKAFDPYRGWSVLGGSAEIVEALSKRAIGQAISSLEDVISGDNTELTITLSPAIVEGIRKANPGCHDVALHVSKGSILAIIDHVRNLVLDWALDLERAGILGDGLNFTATEQQLAVASPMNIQIDGPNARVNLGSTDYSVNSNDQATRGA